MIDRKQREGHREMLARPNKHKVTKKYEENEAQANITNNVNFGEKNTQNRPQSANPQSTKEKDNKKKLNYRISERIKFLAVPPQRYGPEHYIRKDPYKINPEVLKYKATPRIEELARHKERCGVW